MDEASTDEAWRRRGQRAAEKVGFALPEGVTMKRGPAPDGVAYYFRHRELGELGRARIVDDGHGHSRLVGEVAGDEADPQTAKRAELFAPLYEQLHHVLDEAAGVAHVPAPPSPMPRKMTSAPRGGLTIKLMHCERCGKPVARLIFAPTGTHSRGEFEDVARMTFPLCAEQPLPTWIVGPGNPVDVLTGTDPMEIRSLVMPIWPEHGALFESSPSQFNRSIQALQDSHCPTKVGRRRPSVRG
ncbi:hypothetical protein [Rhodanobacter denitrificans]|uniref:hypothetical protein n=1 Tax=Rhodanobacter denitrificans TaxID=666685 RepID=UPI000A96315D|nr:hypothetical protein [Rhodanobacter denitrificans]UJJ53034.1 hypothetical protein LRK52_18170 [Rhodanobacter denitrificans]